MILTQDWHNRRPLDASHLVRGSTSSRRPSGCIGSEIPAADGNKRELPKKEQLKKKPAGKRLQARPAGQVSSQGAHPSPEDTMKTTCDKKSDKY